MRATWIFGAIAGLGCLIALGCGGSDSGEGKASPDTRAVRALIDSMHFDGGIVYLERIPPTSDGVVELLSEPFDSLIPGVAGLLPFEEENPHDDDASRAVLLQFGEEASHVEVPVASNVSEEPGELSFAYELDDAVCEDLCNRRYTITLTAAIKLESGGIGEHLEAEIVLDCRASGSEQLCADGEQSEAPPNTSEMDAGGDGDADSGDPDASMSSDLIGEAGGTVSLPDGAEAVIPAMAVAEPTPIALRVAAQTPELPSDVEGAGQAYVFEPHGTQFNEPVTLRLPFEGSATGLRVLFLDDEDDDAWEQSEGTPAFEDGVAELEVTHFSIYQVVRPRPVTVPGEPVVLVPYPHINSATVIEVDDEYVYWTSSWVGPDPADPLPPASGSYVMRIPKEGGTPEVIYEAPAGENPIHQGFFALSDTSAYIKRGIDIYHDSLIKVAKDGSSAVEIAQPVFNSGSEVAIDSQRIYFGSNTAGTIQSVPLDGGPITTVVQGNVEMAQLPIEPGSGNEVPWQGIEGMMSDGTNLYYACGSNGHMMQVPVGGGVPRILFQADPTAVNDTVGYVYVTSWPCVTGGFVYWTTYGSVFKTSIDEGGTPTPVVVSPISAQGSGPQTVTDGDYLYYVDDTFLKKVSVDGGTPIIVAEPGGFTKFAIDDTSVYLIGSSGQSIVKVPK